MHSTRSHSTAEEGEGESKDKHLLVRYKNNGVYGVKSLKHLLVRAMECNL